MHTLIEAKAAIIKVRTQEPLSMQIEETGASGRIHPVRALFLLSNADISRTAKKAEFISHTKSIIFMTSSVDLRHELVYKSSYDDVQYFPRQSSGSNRCTYDLP